MIRKYRSSDLKCTFIKASRVDVKSRKMMKDLFLGEENLWRKAF